MEIGAGVALWTLLLLCTAPHQLQGQSTPALTPDPTLNEVISPALHVTQKSEVVETQPDPDPGTGTEPDPNPAPVSQFPLLTAATARPPSEPHTHSAARTDAPPPPGSTHTPAPGHRAHTEKAFSESSLSFFSTSSSSITPGAAFGSTAASTTLNEGHQTPSHQSTVSSPDTSQTTLADSSSPASTMTALTNKTEPTRPVPLENPHQDGSSELDVGDEDSAKVPHASPLDPLLAALVSVFIVSTALVSIVLFLRFRQQSEHPEFHRLQDLPMDDLLEDTPLSRYSY